jgi:hypothetical protein
MMKELLVEMMKELLRIMINKKTSPYFPHHLGRIK